MRSRAVGLLNAFTIAVLLAGCRSSDVRTDAERTRSVQGVLATRIAGRPLDVYLKQRTAVLISGSLLVSTAWSNGQQLTVGFQGSRDAVLDGPAHAVAIAADGYFLTAAHCLHPGHLNYLAYWDGSRAKIAPARTVFHDQERTPDRDVAILHVDAELPCIFEWCTADVLAAGTAVVAVGHSDLSFVSDSTLRLSQECFAGRMAAVRTLPTDFLEVRSQIPARRGDSGGPLATVDGTLIAVHSQGHSGPFSSFTSIALRPDPAWVERILQTDREHRPPTNYRPVGGERPDTSSAPILMISLGGQVQDDDRAGTKATQ